MQFNKLSYFQGTEEPTPGKKQYKSEPALVIQPRFKEPFYYNYDLYAIPGMEEIGPGTGYHGLQNYQSVEQFLKDRRNRLKSRYVADDSWKLDNGKLTKHNPNITARSLLLNKLIKLAKDVNCIDFPIDDEINHYDQMIYPGEENYQNPTLVGPNGTDNFATFPSDTGTTDFSSYINSTQIAGQHSYLPLADEEGRSADALDFGRDYTGDLMPGDLNEDDLAELAKKYLEPSETGLFGLPDGLSPEDHDAVPLEQVEDPFTGISDIGTNIYDDRWNI